MDGQDLRNVMVVDNKEWGVLKNKALRAYFGRIDVGIAFYFHSISSVLSCFFFFFFDKFSVELLLSFF